MRLRLEERVEIECQTRDVLRENVEQLIEEVALHPLHQEPSIARKLIAEERAKLIKSLVVEIKFVLDEARARGGIQGEKEAFVKIARDLVLSWRLPPLQGDVRLATDGLEGLISRKLTEHVRNCMKREADECARGDAETEREKDRRSEASELGESCEEPRNWDDDLPDVHLYPKPDLGGLDECRIRPGYG